VILAVSIGGDGGQQESQGGGGIVGGAVGGGVGGAVGGVGGGRRGVTRPCICQLGMTYAPKMAGTQSERIAR